MINKLYIKNIDDTHDWEQFLKFLAVPAAVIIFNENDENFQYVNYAMCELMGTSSDKLLGIRVWDVFAPQDVNYARKICLTLLTNPDSPANFRTDIINLEGQKLSLELSLSIIKFEKTFALLVVARDITEQKNREAERQYQQHKLALVNKFFKGMTIYKEPEELCLNFIKELKNEFKDYIFEIALVEDNNIIILSLNNDNKWQKKYYILDQTYLKYIIYKSQIEARLMIEDYYDKVDENIVSQGYPYMLNIPIKGIDGAFGIFRIAFMENIEPNDRNLLVDVISEIDLALESILYRSKIEKINRLRVEEDKNALISKFALIGEMSASIAHEIRNPMTTVRGLAQLLSNDADEETKYYYELMIEEIDRANKLLGDFLTLARNNASKYELIDMNKLIYRLIDLMYGELVVNDLTFVNELNCSEPLFVYADVEKIKQAFLNIIRNAIEAMEPGGKLKIISSGDSENVVISIIDDGIGIKNTDKQKIMEPFYSTKVTGTGLGLSVCYKIVKDHSGDLIVESEEGRGTTVSLILPRLFEENIQ